MALAVAQPLIETKKSQSKSAHTPAKRGFGSASLIETKEGPDALSVQSGAEALAEFDGVWRVAVFGSVARGTADEGSDIDYVVVCGEIDYENRRELKNKMKGAAIRATGHRVDIVLSDTEEWQARTAVASSLEAHLEPRAVDLVRLAHPQPNKKRRTITMASRMELAVVELIRLGRSLETMEQVARPSSRELKLKEADNYFKLEECRENRWRRTLQEADMVLEHGLAALGAATASPRVGHRKFHQIAAMRDILVDERVKSLASNILDPLRVEELPINMLSAGEQQLEFTKFRVVSTYNGETEADEYLIPWRVQIYIDASLAMASLAFAETLKLEHPPHSIEADEEALATFSHQLKDATDFFKDYDPITGLPTP